MLWSPSHWCSMMIITTSWYTVQSTIAAAITQAMWVKGIITTEEKAKIDTKNAQAIDNSKRKKK